MPDSRDKRLDRYLAGELSAADERELAQASLDDPELFDVMTAAAIVKATLGQSDLPRAQNGVSVGSSKRSHVALTLTGVLALAATIAFVMVYRSSSKSVPSPATTSLAPSAASGAGSAPPVESPRLATQPVLLTARLDELARQSTSEFRGLEANSRAPKSDGVVVLVEEGEVTVDLGSLDGLVKGSELEVSRGREDAKVVGRVTTATVFRERSRGQAPAAAALQVGDRVAIAPAVHVTALLEHAMAHLAGGDAKSARALAELAVTGSRRPGVPSDTRRRALARLGTLEHRDVALDEAVRHLRLAADEFDAAPAAAGAERADVLNELGTVFIERRDYAEADRVLRAALAHATGAARALVTNNLGALAALGGDRVAAEAMYRSALALTGGTPDLEADRRAIEKNLEGLRASR